MEVEEDGTTVAINKPEFVEGPPSVHPALEGRLRRDWLVVGWRR
jgi:hypothetical protein